MRIPYLASAVAVAATLTLAACGGGGSSTPASGAGAGSTTPPLCKVDGSTVIIPNEAQCSHTHDSLPSKPTLVYTCNAKGTEITVVGKSNSSSPSGSSGPGGLTFKCEKEDKPTSTPPSSGGVSACKASSDGLLVMVPSVPDTCTHNLPAIPGQEKKDDALLSFFSGSNPIISHSDNRDVAGQVQWWGNIKLVKEAACASNGNTITVPYEGMCSYTYARPGGAGGHTVPLACTKDGLDPKLLGPIQLVAGDPFKAEGTRGMNIKVECIKS